MSAYSGIDCPYCGGNLKDQPHADDHLKGETPCNALAAAEGRQRALREALEKIVNHAMIFLERKSPLRIRYDDLEEARAALRPAGGEGEPFQEWHAKEVYTAERPAKAHEGDRIEKRPGKCGGHATIKGTRITVRTLAYYQRKGMTPERAASAHGYGLTAEDVQAAWDYVEAHPEEVAEEAPEGDPAEVPANLGIWDPTGRHSSVTAPAGREHRPAPAPGAREAALEALALARSQIALPRTSAHPEVWDGEPLKALLLDIDESVKKAIRALSASPAPDPARDLAFCPTCPSLGATFDEDGLCISCGGTVARVGDFLDALARYRAARGGSK